MAFRKVLVPLDGSPLAEEALWQAIQVADRDGLEVALLRAAEARASLGADPGEAQVRAVRTAEEYLEEVAAWLRQAGVRGVTTHVWYGPPVPSIVEAADALAVDLVVMSTHGRSGLSRLLLGSVAEAVVRATSRPVLLVRSLETAGARALRAAGACRRILVPLDGSPAAETIIPLVLEIAGPRDAEVVLLRALELLAPQALEGSRHVVVDDLEARRAEAEAYLAAIVAELAARGVRATARVRPGDPGPTIAAAVGETGADLVAMTTHGRSGLSRVVFGSIAESVLRRAEVPVLVMRQTEAQVAARTPAGAARPGGRR